MTLTKLFGLSSRNIPCLSKTYIPCSCISKYCLMSPLTHSMTFTVPFSPDISKLRMCYSSLQQLNITEAENLNSFKARETKGWRRHLLVAIKQSRHNFPQVTSTSQGVMLGGGVLNVSPASVLLPRLNQRERLNRPLIFDLFLG